MKKTLNVVHNYRATGDHEKDPNVGSLSYVNVAKKTMKKTLIT